MTHACRIGLLTPGWPGQNTPNGIATSVYFLAQGLHEIGQTPVILARSIDGEDPAGIPVVSTPQLRWRWQDRLRARLGDPDAGPRHIARGIAAAVNEAIAVHGLDAVIMEETNGWAGWVQARVPIPVILTLHGPWVLHKSLQSKLGPKGDRQRESRENRGYATAAGLIAPSRVVLEAVEKATTLPEIPKIVLPNTLPPGASNPRAAGLQPRDILFVGRFDRHKGGDTVLAAFAKLATTHPEARLTFAGPDRGVRLPDGSRRHIEAALEALPPAVRARVTYAGSVGRNEVAHLRSTHAIALIASRFENLNYTLLEAMAAGQAIVCTDVGGPAEVLEDGETALLVPPEDPDAMAAALHRLLSDPALAGRLGVSARNKIRVDFNQHTVAKQVIEFINGIL
jgi:glycosyltransferase involved in cell wall biosynthesis